MKKLQYLSDHFAYKSIGVSSLEKKKYISRDIFHFILIFFRVSYENLLKYSVVYNLILLLYYILAVAKRFRYNEVRISSNYQD